MYTTVYHRERFQTTMPQSVEAPAECLLDQVAKLRSNMQRESSQERQVPQRRETNSGSMPH